MRYIKAKTILSRVRNDKYFGLSYNMNLYRGCQHDCIYCDSRSDCYRLGELGDIRAKRDALQILQNELRSKRTKGTVGFGSMNDPYMPVEKKIKLTRGALKVIEKYQFPVHILTKSDLVIRDTDILRRIAEKDYAAVSFTITTANDNLAKKIEPGAPTPFRRFRAMKICREKGIYTGLMMMPILPFLLDNPGNIETILKMAVDHGAEYCLPWFGMSLREGSAEYFYNQLDRLFPGVKSKYMRQFKNSYMCPSPRARELYDYFHDLCRRTGISPAMRFRQPPEKQQLELFGP